MQSHTPYTLGSSKMPCSSSAFTYKRVLQVPDDKPSLAGAGENLVGTVPCSPSKVRLCHVTRMPGLSGTHNKRRWSTATKAKTHPTCAAYQGTRPADVCRGSVKGLKSSEWYYFLLKETWLTINSTNSNMSSGHRNLHNKKQWITNHKTSCPGKHFCLTD